MYSSASSAGYLKGGHVLIIGPPHNNRKQIHTTHTASHPPVHDIHEGQTGVITREGSSSNGGWFEIRIDITNELVYYRRGSLKVINNSDDIHNIDLIRHTSNDSEYQQYVNTTHKHQHNNNSNNNNNNNNNNTRHRDRERERERRRARAAADRVAKYNNVNSNNNNNNDNNNNNVVINSDKDDIDNSNNNNIQTRLCSSYSTASTELDEYDDYDSSIDNESTATYSSDEFEYYYKYYGHSNNSDNNIDNNNNTTTTYSTSSNKRRRKQMPAMRALQSCGSSYISWSLYTSVY